jgi:hypothetical protein
VSGCPEGDWQKRAKKNPKEMQKDLVDAKRFITFAARLIEDGSYLKY